MAWIMLPHSPGYKPNKTSKNKNEKRYKGDLISTI